MRLGYMLILVFATAMLGILVFDGRPALFSLDDTTDQSSYYRLFPTIDSVQQITGIELVIPEDGLGVAIETGDNGVTWHLRNTEVEVDAKAAYAARQYLAGMVGIGQLDRSDISPEVLGFLPEAQYVVRFRLDDSRIVTLIIGDLTPSGDAYYVSPTLDSAIVDLVPTDWIDSFVISMGLLEPIEADADETIPRSDDSEE